MQQGRLLVAQAGRAYICMFQKHFIIAQRHEATL